MIYLALNAGLNIRYRMYNNQAPREDAVTSGLHTHRSDATSAKQRPHAPTSLAPRRATADWRSPNELRLTNPSPLPPHDSQLGVAFRRQADRRPDAVFIAERDGDGWRRVTYAQARAQVDALSQALLDNGHGGDRPVAFLSANSVNYALLKLAAMQVGIPVLPVSTAYSTASADFAKLRRILGRMNPSAIYVDRAAAYRAALAGAAPADAQVVADDPAGLPHAAAFETWAGATPGAAVETAFRRVGPHSLAKILMTSGSTGEPKGARISQGMMMANGAAVDAVWPFLSERPPVLLDWLPWSHTFGANFNLNQIIRHGGTLYLDAGRPAPGLIETTIENLRRVRPTLLYNVPRGFDALLPILEQDEALRRHVFADLDIIFYAGAGLSQPSWDRLEALAVDTRGVRLPILSSLGSTETGPVATLSHWGSDVTGSVGLPVPGTELRLVQAAERWEMRVRGPSVTTGYYGDEAASATAFDDEGYFRLGDAVRFAGGDPAQGLLFDGRLSENFKLSTGTWVHVGSLRLALVDALSPMAQDVVIAGRDRDEIRILIIPNLDACRIQAETTANAPAADVLSDPRLTAVVEARLAQHNRTCGGSSRAVAGHAFLSEPLSIDRGELTDKGYVNQQRVLTLRAAEVDALYARPAAAAHETSAA